MWGVVWMYSEGAHPHTHTQTQTHIHTFKKKDVNESGQETIPSHSHTIPIEQNFEPFVGTQLNRILRYCFTPFFSPLWYSMAFLCKKKKINRKKANEEKMKKKWNLMKFFSLAFLFHWKADVLQRMRNKKNEGNEQPPLNDTEHSTAHHHQRTEQNENIK